MQEESVCDTVGEPLAPANATSGEEDYPGTEPRRVHRDGSAHDRFSLTVVDALAAATGTDPNAIDPLYSVVDPDALDAVLAADDTADVEVTFAYDDWWVTVRGNGEVTVRESG
jgi:hypothetical protein